MYIKDKIENFMKNKQYNIKTDMCKLFMDRKSDKSTWHNYSTLYNILFSDFIDKNINFFELGLGTNDITISSNMGRYGKPGASLYAFRDFFKNAKIFGADIDDKILFSDENIQTFYVDQTDPGKIKSLWEKLGETRFDIIIDDGLHEFHANKTFFDESFHMLKHQGIYIIEDIIVSDKKKFIDYFYSKNFTYSELLEIPMSNDWAESGRINDYDNCLLILQK